MPSGPYIDLSYIDKDVIEMDFSFEDGYWEEMIGSINLLKATKDNQNNLQVNTKTTFKNAMKITSK